MLEVDCLTSGWGCDTSRVASFPAMARASSSCTVNMSPSVRSYVSDQSWYPSAALISCAAIRNRSPALRTLPSSTVPTLRRAATSRTSVCAPLNAKADIRAATRRPETFASAPISSSVIPSLTYSVSGSGPRLTNGSTAMEAMARLERRGGGVGVRRSSAARAVTGASGAASSSVRTVRSCSRACCSAAARSPAATSARIKATATRELNGSSPASRRHHAAAPA